jgi:hypothetical protein
MLNLIYMDLLLSEMWIPQLFYGANKLDEDYEPLNSFFDENGYSSKYLLKNLGSTLAFLVAYLALWFFLLFLKLLSIFSARYLFILTITFSALLAYQKLKTKLMWRLSIELFISQYPPMLVASLINL